MNDHSDRQAPRAEVAGRRQGKIIAKLLGALALASFLLMVSAGTARALGIGEIVEESPLDPVTDTVETVTAPVTEAVEPVTDTVETVAEPVTEAVEPVTDPVEEFTETVAQAAEPVTDTATDVASTVPRTVEEPVNRAVEAAEPVTETVVAVTETVTETIEQPVTEVSGTVGRVLEEVREPIQPVLDVIDETVERTTEVIGGVTAPVLDGVDDLVDPALPSIPAPDGATDVGTSGPNPDPVLGPPSPVDTSNPAERPATSDGPLSRPVLVPVPSLLTTPPSGVTQSQTEAEGGSTRESPPTPITMADAVGGGGSLGDEGSPVGGDPSPRALARPTASGSSSSSGAVSNLLAVIVLLGLIAPRLSRWLRSRPVLWRPYALAEALELPG
jgi:hypothetical protein